MFGSSSRQNNHPHHHHHHYPNAHHKGGPPLGTASISPESAKATDVFELFINASTFKSVLHHYRHICELLKLRPTNYRNFYPKLKSNIRSWKAQALWSKFDRRASHKCYNHGTACENSKVLVIGAGPCGLRSAIEAQFLGAKVVVVEKRDRFSRNNVLHLWPFVISDLRALGAKKFYGKFCAGAIDHISIRQLQCILLKVALLLGVEVIEAVTFENLLEPPEDQSERIGWHARFSPLDHPVNQYEFDVLIGADGKRNTLLGFKRKEFRGKLAIAITANFINKHTEYEARVQEISGVAFIFNQKFFKELYAETGIDLENIVYYKDETHYFVMTAKKHSLIDKGVILNDYSDTQQLLHSNNIDREALSHYAREAADFSTNGQLPHLDFAVNHYGKPDIAMFDFTSMFQADNACRVVERRGHKLLQCLVGDSLLEPFWPTGSGCPRGFLSSFDACWAIRSWSPGKMTPLEVIAERESAYRLLAQTTPENLSKDIHSYTLEPSSRYPTVNLRAVLPFQVCHLLDTDDQSSMDTGSSVLDENVNTEDSQRKRKRRNSIIHADTLLTWVQKQIEVFPYLKVENMTTSFKDGRILCAIIQRYYPNLIDIENLNAENEAENIQIAFDLLERDFGIPPIMTGKELADCDTPDKLRILSYLTQIYDAFRGQIPQFSFAKKNGDDYLLFEQTDSTPESSSVSKHRSENILRCRIVNDTETNSTDKESFQKTKKRRNELGSLDDVGKDVQSEDSFKYRKPIAPTEPFSDRIKDLEAKFRSETSTQQKPKDLVRAIGKLEKTDWQVAAIEKKIEDNVKPSVGDGRKEKVPRWSKDLYYDKYYSIERRLRENGEDEDRIAKYLDIDASLKRLEMKLREGSTLETGLRGHNKVSNLANQLSSKLVRKEEEKIIPSKQNKPLVLQTSASDLCHFCGTRVYLVEKLSAEGKFFHQKCFKCNYCGAMLKMGNYAYDRDGRYGGKFFCISHFGMSQKNKLETKAEITEKENTSLNMMAYQNRSPNVLTPKNKEESTPSSKGLSVTALLTPITQTLEDRGTTPERAEFENTLMEQSDEEYLSEDEWTDRNFGASANELDESDDDDSDYSDLGTDEEADIEDFENDHKLTADETRSLAESWKRRYSTKSLENKGVPDDSDLEPDTDNYSEELGADGDESHAATEGEDEPDEEIEDEHVRKARELRKQEFNIDFKTPHHEETSDSGSDTEIASDEETEESDTQIDTDSEFADDSIPSHPPKEIPTIVIDESLDANGSLERISVPNKDEEVIPKKESAEPKKEYIEERVSLICNDKKVTENKVVLPLLEKANQQNIMEEGEKCSSLSNLAKVGNSNFVTGFQQHALQRTESTEAVSTQKVLSLRRQYLLGNPNNAPRKSVSTTDLGNRFKSFMERISETQKMLNPAPQPSPAMQAFLSSSTPKRTIGNLSSTSPSLNLPRLASKTPLSIQKSVSKDIKEITAEASSDSSKSDEGEIFVIPTVNKNLVETNKDMLILDDSNNVSSKVNDVEDKLSKSIDENIFKSSSDSKESDGEYNESKNEMVLAAHLEVNQLEGNTPEALNFADITVEAVNPEIIEHFNLNSVSTSPPICVDVQHLNIEKSKESSDNESDIDKIFDQLANDAINEMEDLDNSHFFTKDYSHSNVNTDLSYNESKQKEVNKSSVDSSPIEESQSLFNDKEKKDIVNIDEIHEMDCFVTLKESMKEELSIDIKSPLARISSLESIEDSSSLLSPVNQIIPNSNQCPLMVDKSENKDIDFADTSQTDVSSHEDVLSHPIAYSVLEEDTPTAPISSVADFLKSKENENKLGFIEGQKRKEKIIPKSNSVEDNEKDEVIARNSLSEPASLIEESKIDFSKPNGTDKDFSKRYEMCIPRFKEHISPFRNARDSIDVRKNSGSTPLYTPSKEDIRERMKNELPFQLSIQSPLEPSFSEEKLSHKDSSTNISSSPEKSLSIESPKRASISSNSKDGDLVRDMVLSRLNKKSYEKSSRRNSRNSLFSSPGTSAASLLEKCVENSSHNSNDSLHPNSTESSSLQSPKDNLSNSHNLERNSSSYYNFEPEIGHSSLQTTRDELSPRSPLPATPLTHPEKFQKSLPFKTDLPVSYNSLSTSPDQRPAYSTSFEKSKLFSYKGLERHSGKDSYGQNILSDNQTSQNPPSSMPYRMEAQDAIKARLNMDKEERLRELLAEHRRKESELPKESKVIDRDRDSCIKECLEEYRQKRLSEPIPASKFKMDTSENLDSTFGESIPSRVSNISQNSFRTDEVKSMHVFTKAEKPMVPLSSASGGILMPIESATSQNRILEPLQELSRSTSAVNVSTQVKKTKKSKDRERRRSLIQVFAGMFKFDDKKKQPVESVPHSNVASPKNPIAASSESLQDTPKSPSMQQRLSKLRITRSKEKVKGKDVNRRCSSVGGNTYEFGDERDRLDAASLPASPSRTLFSFLSTTRLKDNTSFQHQPPSIPQSVETGLSVPLSSKYATPTIKEETLSDMEVKGNSDLDTSSIQQTPSLRRQKAAMRAARQADHKRLRMAQEIQRQLQEWEVKTKDLEERGLWVERALRGEVDDPIQEEPELLKDWFALVHEKNALSRWGKELEMKARELELEDRHVRLENELRQRMACLESEKTREDINREGIILSDMLSVLEEKESLTVQFEEDKRRYTKEDRDLEEIMLQKGLPAGQVRSSLESSEHY